MATRGRQSDEHGTYSDSEGDVDLIDTPSEDLASSLPESLTIEVSLPNTVHAAPEDELAVAIVEVPVNPGFVEVTEPTTTSIMVVPPVPEAEPEPEAPYIPELPSSDDRALSRRDRMRGEVSNAPEVAGMLTADRLINVRRKKRAKPEGGLNAFLYAITFHAVNRGDSPKVRARKAIEARIDKKFEGGARFIPVLTRKGGVGKTTITALLGMALSDTREDRVIAIDANPDRGTLSERVNKQTRSTVRDVVTMAPTITSFNDFTAMVSRDETRLDILASDTDPLLSEAFDENDYNVVADLAARFYSIVLTDCGTGIVHSVMRATLQRADSVVIVSGGSVDEARLASETLTWLEANGYGELVRNAVVALNTATQGTNLVKLEEIEAHFKSRVREIVRIPYDPQLAAGSVINYKELRPLTKASARELAALVTDGLPARQGA
jgi:MinD-like ATPase involved in chromosome partitioning or flagellar assembly